MTLQYQPESVENIRIYSSNYILESDSNKVSNILSTALPHLESTSLGAFRKLSIFDRNGDDITNSKDILVANDPKEGKLAILLDKSSIQESDTYPEDVQRAFVMAAGSKTLWKSMTPDMLSGINTIHVMKGQPEQQTMQEQVIASMRVLGYMRSAGGILKMSKILTIVEEDEYAKYLNNSQYSNRYIQQLARMLGVPVPDINSISIKQIPNKKYSAMELIEYAFNRE